ncbi:NAD/NADP octopine/nopaline dehydrogenase family protein [Rhizobium ruizarguesonis]
MSSNRDNRVGVLQIGNAGLAHIVDLKRRGFETIALSLEGHTAAFDLMDPNHIEATQAITGVFKTEKASDVGDIFNTANTIIVASVAAAHHGILEKLEALDQPGRAGFNFDLSQKVIIINTCSFIAPWAKGHLHGAKNVIFLTRSPYTSRWFEKEGRAAVRVNGIKKRFHFASLKRIDHDTYHHVAKVIGLLAEQNEDPLENALDTNQGYVHPPTMLRNQDKIAAGAELYFYRDLMTKEVCDEIEAGNAETRAVIKALGYKDGETALEMFNRDYGTNYATLREFVVGCEQLNRKPTLPASMMARQITQDIPDWVVPVCCIAKALGVPVPVMRGWVDEASALPGHPNYWETGKTLETFGLSEDASADEIKAAFNLF